MKHNFTAAIATAVLSALSPIMPGPVALTPRRGRVRFYTANPAGAKLLRRAYRNHTRERGTYMQARDWYAQLKDGE